MIKKLIDALIKSKRNNERNIFQRKSLLYAMQQCSDGCLLVTGHDGLDPGATTWFSSSSDRFV